MGQRVKYYLDDIEINPPNNYQELEIELNYDSDGNQQALSVNEWEFGVGDPAAGNDGMIMCRNQFSDQAGIGVVQGKPFRITIDDEDNTTYDLFNGYVDLWKAKYERGKITASAVQAGEIDWLNDYADSFTFEYLYSIGFFGSDKFVPVPYVIVKKQDAFEIVMTMVTIFVLTDKLISQVKEVAQLATGSANPFEMSTVARLILQILYIIVLFISLITLLLKLFYIMMPPVKFHNTMYVRDLFQIACDYMGLKFRSSILLAHPFDKLVIMPEKFNLTENKGLFAGVAGDLKNNNEKTGFFKGTFGDLIRQMKTMFYGKIVIKDGYLYFERYDFRLGNDGIKVPYSFNNEQTFTLNYDDFFSTMILSFMPDLADRHTVQEYTGTSVQVTQTAKTSIDQRMSLLRNLKEDRIQFALAKRKTELTIIEEIVGGFLTAMDVVLGIIIVGLNLAIIAINILIMIINKVIKSLAVIGIVLKIQLKPIKKIQKPKFGAAVKNRIGMVKMESDFVAVPKIFLIEQASNPKSTKMHALNESVVNARYLFENFHYHKSFVSMNGRPDNQYLLRESEKFPFSFKEYEQSLSNNAIFTPDGLEGEMISLKFNPTKQYATCTYKVRKHYLSNLKLEIYEPSGQ